MAVLQAQAPWRHTSSSSFGNLFKALSYLTMLAHFLAKMTHTSGKCYHSLTSSAVVSGRQPRQLAPTERLIALMELTKALAEYTANAVKHIILFLGSTILLFNYTDPIVEQDIVDNLRPKLEFQVIFRSSVYDTIRHSLNRLLLKFGYLKLIKLCMFLQIL